MKHVSFVLLLFLTVADIPSTVYAHHAKEFLRTESYAQPPMGGMAIFSGFDYFKPEYRGSANDEWEYTPTIAYGIFDQLMFNFHTHLKHIPNYSPFFEAIATSLQYQVTRPEKYFLDIACALQYEIPLPRSRELLDGKHILTPTLILSKELPHDINVTFNFYYSREIAYGSGNEFGYSAAVKGHIIPSVNWMEAGLEFIGTIDKDPCLSIVPGIYVSLGNYIVLKGGSSFGLTENTEDFAIHIIAAFNFQLATF